MNNQHSLVKHAFPFSYTCCFILLLAGCASSDNTGDSTSGVASAQECRTAGSAGTKLKRSVCMSAEEWALADAKAQESEDLKNEYFRRVRENSTQGAGPAFSTPSGAP